MSAAAATEPMSSWRLLYEPLSARRSVIGQLASRHPSCRFAPCRRRGSRTVARFALAGSRSVLAQGGEVRIGYQKGSANLLVLKAEGALEERLGKLDYTVSWTEFPSGPPLLEALNAGSIDFGATGAPPPIFAQAAGADLIYALASKPSPRTQAIIVPADSADPDPRRSRRQEGGRDQGLQRERAPGAGVARGRARLGRCRGRLPATGRCQGGVRGWQRRCLVDLGPLLRRRGKRQRRPHDRYG